MNRNKLNRIAGNASRKARKRASDAGIPYVVQHGGNIVEVQPNGDIRVIGVVPEEIFIDKREYQL